MGPTTSWIRSADLPPTWAIDNQPTYRSEDLRFRAGVRPLGQDHLWFRVQMMYGAKVSDPRQVFTGTGV